MRFTVVRSKVIDILNKDYYYYYYKAVHVRFVDKHQPPLVNYVSTTRQWDFKIQCFGRQCTVFSRLFKRSKHGSSYRG